MSDKEEIPQVKVSLNVPQELRDKVDTIAMALQMKPTVLMETAIRSYLKAIEEKHGEKLQKILKDLEELRSGL